MRRSAVERPAVFNKSSKNSYTQNKLTIIANREDNINVSRVKLSPEAIKEKMPRVGGWKEKEGCLVKRFKFNDFASSLDLVNRVGAAAEERDHHPDISFGWGYAEFSITTHDRGGLTELDFALAEEIDRIAED